MTAKRVLLVASMILVCAGCGHVDGGGQPRSADFCSQAAAQSIDPNQTFSLPGVYTSDQLHGAFLPSACPSTGLTWSIGEMSNERRGALERFMGGIRGDRTGFVDFPIVLIGRVEPRGEFGGLNLVATDFAEMD